MNPAIIVKNDVEIACIKGDNEIVRRKNPAMGFIAGAVIYQPVERI